MSDADEQEIMSSTRPYLIRAFYEWIVDNEMTPYVVIDATTAMVRVPQQYIEDGKIVLNISPMATEELMLSNHRIEFEASFGGKVEQISAPIRSVVAIYARENGRGMVFGDDDDEFDDDPMQDDDGGDDGGAPPSGGKPKLRVVK